MRPTGLKKAVTYQNTNKYGEDEEASLIKPSKKISFFDQQ